MHKNWKIIECGTGPQKLKIYTRAANTETARMAAVIDIGSGSVKADMFDVTSFPPTTIDDVSFDCGLGEGNVPDSPAPRLNPRGIAMTFADAVPAINALLHKHRPDSVMIIATEAVRAAIANPAEQANVESFLSRLAKELNVPREAVNIASNAMEAHLVIQGALTGDFGNGLVAMMGGGSAEFGKIVHRQQIPEHCTTLRFGTRSLAASTNPLDVVRKQMNTVPWLKGSPDKRLIEMCLLGGVFRCAGRALARRLYASDYTAQPQPDHYAFVWNKALEAELRRLQNATYETLFADFFGFRPDEIGRHTTSKHIELADNRRITKKKFTELRGKFDKRMGCRAEFVGVASEILLELGQRLKPHTVRFSTHNIRDGAIRDTGLGAASPRFISAGMP